MPADWMPSEVGMTESGDAGEGVEDLDFDEDEDIWNSDRDDASEHLGFAPEGVDEATFNSMRDNPAGWAWYAQHLMEAAEVVQKAEDLAVMAILKRTPAADSPFAPRTFHGPRMMLAGLAIENILKALFIATKPVLVSGKLGKDLDSHDLADLAKRADVSITDQDLKFLRKLTLIVKWAGRYHVGKLPQTTPKWQAGGFAAFNSARRLFTDFWTVYERRCPSPPPSPPPDTPGNPGNS